VATNKSKDSKEPAEETKEGESSAPAKPPKAPWSKKKKLIFIAIASTVLLSSSGLGAWFLMRETPPQEEPVEKAPEPKKVPVFVDLDSFTVNLQRSDPDEDDQYMQIKIVVEAKDSPTGELIKSMMPSIRSEIILLLSSKSAQDISTREGKEQLAKEVVLAANKPLVRTPAENSIEGVNFTHIIIQ